MLYRGVLFWDGIVYFWEPGIYLSNCTKLWFLVSYKNYYSFTYLPIPAVKPLLFDLFIWTKSGGLYCVGGGIYFLDLFKSSQFILFPNPMPKKY